MSSHRREKVESFRVCSHKVKFLLKFDEHLEDFISFDTGATSVISKMHSHLVLQTRSVSSCWQFFTATSLRIVCRAMEKNDAHCLNLVYSFAIS